MYASAIERWLKSNSTASDGISSSGDADKKKGKWDNANAETHQVSDHPQDYATVW